jgi:protein-disulfide isomerase
VVEFGDLGCSACAQFALETWPAIDEEFVQTGRVRWKVVPFVLGAFRNSKEATAAALCAAQQEAFWPMQDRLFHEQKRWSAPRDPRSVLRQLAVTVGVDSVRFERCYQDKETAKRIREFTKLAKQFSVDATPTFLVGERRIRGALPISLFRQVLLEAAVR